jgi:uncharacterized protein
MRPKKERTLKLTRENRYFIPSHKILVQEELTLYPEEVEVIYLKDLKNLDQKKAANEMSISQSTFHRILKQARKKIARSIIEGHALKTNEKD